MRPNNNTPTSRALLGGIVGAFSGGHLGIFLPWLLLGHHTYSPKGPISWAFKAMEEFMRFFAMMIGAGVLGIIGGIAGSAIGVATHDSSPVNSDREKPNGANSASDPVSVEQEITQLKRRLAELELPRSASMPTSSKEPN